MPTTRKADEKTSITRSDPVRVEPANCQFSIFGTIKPLTESKKPERETLFCKNLKKAFSKTTANYFACMRDQRRLNEEHDELSKYMMDFITGKVTKPSLRCEKIIHKTMNYSS